MGAQSRDGREAGLRRARWHGGAQVSHRVGPPVAPAFAAVGGHAGARLAAEVPAAAHAASGRPRSAVALGLRGVGLLARPLAGPRLPGGQLLPHFPRGALCQGRPPTPHLESVPVWPVSSPLPHWASLAPVSPPQRCLHSSRSLWTFRPPDTPFCSYPPSQTLLASSSGLASSRKPPLTSPVRPNGSVCSTSFICCECCSLVSEPETDPAPPAVACEAALGCPAGGAPGSLHPQSPLWQSRAHVGPEERPVDLRQTGTTQHRADASAGALPGKGPVSAHPLDLSFLICLEITLHFLRHSQP